MWQPVTLSEKAALELRALMQHKGIPPGYALRVMAEGGTGCGGVRYRLGFDRAKEGDSTYELAGIPLVYEKRQMLFLMGLQIDFEERPDERGFIFTRPELPQATGQ
jgi:iron-sulfur cluster assembly protein